VLASYGFISSQFIDLSVILCLSDIEVHRSALLGAMTSYPITMIGSFGGISLCPRLSSLDCACIHFSSIRESAHAEAATGPKSAFPRRVYPLPTPRPSGQMAPHKTRPWTHTYFDGRCPQQSRDPPHSWQRSLRYASDEPNRVAPTSDQHETELLEPEPTTAPKYMTLRSRDDQYDSPRDNHNIR
jgi:hypothetical protein